MKKSLLWLALLASSFSSAESVLRRVNGAEPRSIDPQLASESAGAAIIYDLFEGLTQTHIDGRIIPGLAEKWEISPDGKNYKFFLRPDAKWSDGQPLKASDVVFAWQRAVNPATASEYAFILAPVKNARAITAGEIKDLNLLGIRALDDHTLAVELEEATPYFLDLLAHYTTYPVPQHVVEAEGKQWTQPGKLVSSGAYQLSSWQPQAQLTVSKSPHYYDAAHVKIDKVIFYPIESENVGLQRYRAGEVDYLLSLPVEQLDWARENLAADLKINPKISTYWYYLNTAKPPLDNPKLREALSLALNREVLVEKITRAGQLPAYSVVPPQMNNSKPYQPDWARLSQPQRLERARQLYAEAGYSQDKPLKIELLYNTNEGHRKIAIAVAAMWKQALGVQTELVNKEWKIMLNDLQNRNFSLARYSWQGDYNDPNTFLEIFKSDAEMNRSGFRSPEYDGLLAQAARTADLNQRAELLQRAEKLLSDSFVVIPVYHYVTVELLKPYVKGYHSNLMQIMPSKYLSLEKEAEK